MRLKAVWQLFWSVALGGVLAGSLQAPSDPHAERAKESS